MISNFKKTISRNLVNIPGFRTSLKIIVFESDDWGSIRMPSLDVYNSLRKYGLPVDKSPYCRIDAIESNDDMIKLFELLSSFKDFKGNNPIITANTVMANPNFEQIKRSGFEEYIYEPFTETLQKYPNRDQVFNLYEQGINEKLFFPQFHGREHVNVELWMNLIRTNKDFKFAFEKGMWGLSSDVFPINKKSVQATFDSHNDEFLMKSIQEGLAVFSDLFKYQSQSFIANNFIWSKSLEKTLAENGVFYLQGMKYQKLPRIGDEPNKLVRHYLGEKNSYKQIYGIRNCNFEPSLDGTDYGKTLREIRNAFFWNKPAIISSHRLNFIGSLDLRNQTDNLNEFKKLIKNILKEWPDAEFMNTVELSNLIRNEE